MIWLAGALVWLNGAVAAASLWDHVKPFAGPLNTALLIVLALVTRRKGNQISARVEHVSEDVTATAVTAQSAAEAASSAASSASEACRVAKSIAAPLRVELPPPAQLPPAETGKRKSHHRDRRRER